MELGAEPSAHVGRDHADRLPLEAEPVLEVGTTSNGNLRRNPYDEAALPRFGEHRVGLHRHRRETLVPDAEPHHRVGALQHVPVPALLERVRHVRAGFGNRSGASATAAGPYDCAERFRVHDHHLRGVLGARERVREDHGDRLADEPWPGLARGAGARRVRRRCRRAVEVRGSRSPAVRTDATPGMACACSIATSDIVACATMDRTKQVCRAASTRTSSTYRALPERNRGSSVRRTAPEDGGEHDDLPQKRGPSDDGGERRLRARCGPPGSDRPAPRTPTSAREVAGGLNQPVGSRSDLVACSGTSRRSGQVRTYDLDTDEDRLFYQVTRVNGDGERGRSDALHPQYPDQPYLYVYATRAVAGKLKNRILRSPTSEGTAGPARDLLEPGQLESLPQRRASCSVPTACCTRSSVTGTTPRTLRTSPRNDRGKILDDLGRRGPATNPRASRMFAFGIRNSFGFAFDPRTDRLLADRERGWRATTRST